METIFTNTRLVCRNEIVCGSLVLRDGRITRIDTGISSACSAEDLNGDYLLPGLIEMHTDNLEKHIVPRPGILWPSVPAAVLAHDTQICGGGITTVFDAIAIGEHRESGVRRTILDNSVAAVRMAKEKCLLRADHYLHLRCEVADGGVLDMIEPYRDDPLVRLMSIMDHTPGQRQWMDLEKWRLYHRDKKWTDQEAEKFHRERLELQTRYAESNRRAIIALSRENGIPLASHDDTTEEHCEEAARDGIRISEFPTTLKAARKGKKLGLQTVMGAPNVVRGQSHSGNISALELARQGLLDALSSDYMPISLLHAPFVLHEKLEIPLPETVAMVSANIADMLKLEDRGEIRVGRRGDLVQVAVHDGLPLAKRVWREGKQIF